MDNRQITENKTWAITTFYNPEHYKNKLVNYRLFKKNLEKQHIKLAAVECVFKKNQFELTKADAEILVQVKSESVLWQKERLLNIALKHLPKDCENVIWIDADIILLNDNWAIETEKCLEEYSIVQPFSYSLRLEKAEKYTDFLPNKIPNSRKRYGCVFCSDTGLNNLPEEDKEHGFVWAGKKSIFDTHGFYDKHIVGGGDYVMKAAFTNNRSIPTYSNNWSNTVKKLINGRVGYINGGLIHLYHGNQKNRYYSDRELILEGNNYKPERDLCLNNDGCWEWSASAPTMLKKEVKKYFSDRNENDSLVKNIKYSFYPRSNQIITVRIAGLIGLFIKNVSPKLHAYLKKKIIFKK